MLIVTDPKLSSRVHVFRFLYCKIARHYESLLLVLTFVDPVEVGCPGTEYCGRKLEKFAAAAAAGVNPGSEPPPWNPLGNCAICAETTNETWL